jgi:hypothetical protein
MKYINNYDEFLLESRSETIKDISGLRKAILEHVLKIFVMPNEPYNTSHWINEIDKFFFEINELRYNNKLFDYDVYHDKLLGKDVYVYKKELDNEIKLLLKYIHKKYHKECPNDIKSSDFIDIYISFMTHAIKLIVNSECDIRYGKNEDSPIKTLIRKYILFK